MESKIALASLLPFANLLVISIERVRLHFSQTDSFLYLGYAIDYSGLQDKWGHTYYASRLSTILPITVREQLGIPNQIWRIGLISVVTICIYFFLIKRTSALKAFLVSIITTNSIWLLNHLSDDMNFAYAIVYMAVSLTLFDHALSKRENSERVIPLVLTGFFVGLTLNSHFIYLFTILPIFLSVVLFRRKNLVEIRGMILQVFAGTILSYTLVILFSIHLSGLTGILNHLINAKQIFVNSGESGRIWTQPILYFFPFLFIILTVPFISVVKFKLKSISSDNRELELSVGILLMGIISVAYHFAFGGPILSITRYCSIYLAPILFLVSLLLIDSKFKILLIVLFLEITTILAFQLIPSGQTSDRLNSVFRIFIILPLLANLLVIRNPKFTKNVGLSLLLVVFALPLTQTWSAFVLTTSSTNSANGEYREFLRSMSTGNSYDEQEFAAKVAMDVKREIPPIFYGWTIYPKTPSFLGAIDSAQLWGYSCYKCMIAGIPIERSYPPFSKEDLIELSKRDYILIFDTSKVGYDRMKSSLLTLSPKFELGAEKTIKGKSNILYYSYIYTGLER